MGFSLETHTCRALAARRDTAGCLEQIKLLPKTLHKTGFSGYVTLHPSGLQLRQDGEPVRSSGVLSVIDSYCPELPPMTCLTHMAGSAASSGFITVRCSDTLEK